MNESKIKEQSIEVIEEFIFDSLFEPNRHWPKLEFDRRTCERWAANEILSRIKKSDNSPIFEILMFMREMNTYSLIDGDHESAYMFQLAFEIAEEIGSLLC